MHSGHNRRGRKLLAMVTIGALILAACGGDDDDTSTDGTTADSAVVTDAVTDTEPATTDAPASTDEPASTEAPESTDGPATTEASAIPEDADLDGVIRVGYDMIQGDNGPVWGDPSEMGILATTNDPLFYLVYGRMFRLDDDGVLQPELAKSATVVDPNTIEIELREGVTFSDGSPFDAAAVKSGLDRALAAQNVNAYREEFFSLESVEVTSPTTVQLSIPDGTAPGWYDAFLHAFEVTIVKDGETDFTKPIGAGPMVVESFEPGASLVLRRNDQYYAAENILPAGLDFVHIDGSAPQTGIAALQADQIDMVTTQPNQIAALGGAYSAYNSVSPDRRIQMQICKKDGPLADPLVRQAINKAIDRDAINELVFYGSAAPSTQLYPEGHRFNNPEVNDVLAYDPEGARALLEEAGYADGFTVDIYTIPFAGIPETAEVLTSQLAEVGITVNIIPTSNNFVTDFLEAQAPGMGIIPASATGISKLDEWNGDSLGNVCSYHDDELADIISQLSVVSASTDEAQDLWNQAADIYVNDALSAFIVFTSQVSAYNNEHIAGLEALPIGQYAVPNPLTTYVKSGG